MRQAPILTDDYEQMSCCAARCVARQVLRDPESVLGLPTGNTPTGMYLALVSMFRDRNADFSRAGVVMLDEFCDVPPEDPRSFQSYIRRNFLDHVNAPGDRLVVLSGLLDPRTVCTEPVSYTHLTLPTN